MNFFDQIMSYFKKDKNTGVRPPLARPDRTGVKNMIDIKEIRKTDRLSKNFRLSELTKSQTASRLGIDNLPSDDHLRKMKILVDNFLQPLRDEIGKPIVVTSGYRSERLNDEINGSNKSQHSKGEAVDIECFGMNNKELAIYIRDNMDFDQLILEFYNPEEGPNSGWVHVSCKEHNNRKEVLSAIKRKGKSLEYHYGITSE